MHMPLNTNKHIARLICAVAVLGLLASALPTTSAHAEQRARTTSGVVRPLAWMSAVASSYGPGLYGNRTACGQILTTTTIGVAHKTLPCGTRLKFLGRYGQVVAATVIDRGPYVSGRTFDITEATVKQMGYASAIDFGVRTVSWDYN